MWLLGYKMQHEHRWASWGLHTQRRYPGCGGNCFEPHWCALLILPVSSMHHSEAALVSCSEFKPTCTQKIKAFTFISMYSTIEIHEGEMTADQHKPIEGSVDSHCLTYRTLFNQQDHHKLNARPNHQIFLSSLDACKHRIFSRWL